MQMKMHDLLSANSVKCVKVKSVSSVFPSEKHIHMSSEDREAQEDELLALASIYTEDEFRRAAYALGGQIRASVELPQGFKIFVDDENVQTPLKGHFEVFFLPPVLLTFELPPDYPSASAPVFVLSCQWLTPLQLSSLCKRLDALWEENKGSVVLFAWMQFLKEETLQHLNILSPYEVTVHRGNCYPERHVTQDGAELSRSTCEATAKSESIDERANQDAKSLDSLIRDILDFDQAQQLKSFQAKPYLCNICFSEKLGSECTQFKVCQHVYCNDCLRGYFEIQIKEGQVHLLVCPEPKCGSVSTPAQVKELVADELFARYDRLLLQSSLDSMLDVVYCPRLNCQTPVVKEPGGTMGICSNCRYAFCDLCKMTYHGVTPCAQPDDESEEEEDGNSTPKESFVVDRNLSYKEIKHRKWEEKVNRQCIANNCKKCPFCAVDIEKNGGCFRMYCTRCLQMFCWDCTLPFSYYSVQNPRKLPSAICTCSH